MADVARGPALRIIQLTKIGVVKYIIENTNLDGIVQGIQDFRAGILPPAFKSEVSVPEQKGAVKPIIGNTFH
ncbi:hypothetical protein, partial [Streptococcus pneumoniae]|uniref:hypothetical protein n=1 Tax=Streptococcus pneumoniae TaxID=1313 RepID=UPI0012D70BBF